METEDAVTVFCQHCGQKYEIDSDVVGSSIYCQKCGQPIFSPGGDAVMSSGSVKWVVVLGAVCFAIYALSRLFSSADAENEIHGHQDDPTASIDEPVVSRQFVRDHIEKNGNCRVVALTQTGGDVVVCGANNWASFGCSAAVVDALEDIVNKGEPIMDVCLTESGRFVVLFGGNAAHWNDIPSSMESALRGLNSNGEVLYSATFNDSGDWIVVSAEHYICSETWIKEWLADGNVRYGQLQAAAVTEDAMVAVFADGFKFFGNVPNDLKDEIRKADFDIRVIKIAGDAWFFADEYGNRYQARM